MATQELISSSEFDAHSKQINSLCFGRSEILASASRDKTIKVWQFTQGRLTNTIVFESEYANSVAFSQNEKILVSGEKNSTIKL
ncbi:MAG: hypothetical protein AAF298_03620 [Cyanobacteria bacterium P01_A01_bin.40]